VGKKLLLYQNPLGSIFPNHVQAGNVIYDLNHFDALKIREDDVFVLTNHLDDETLSKLGESGKKDLFLWTKVPIENLEVLIKKNGLSHIVADTNDFWLLSSIASSLSEVAPTIESFFVTPTELQIFRITKSSERRQLCEALSDFAKSCKIGPSFCKKIEGVCEEMIMNAVFDAPLSKFKDSYYESVLQKDVVLELQHQPILRYGYDGERFGVSVTDPFGMLSRDTFFNYSLKNFRSRENSGQIDEKKEGAGLGLMKILFNSHAVIASVIEQESSEVMAFFEPKLKSTDNAKIAKTMHYFCQKMKSSHS
jgi:hypothetical protein